MIVHGGIEYPIWKEAAAVAFCAFGLLMVATA